jgi:F5/8 type C domain
MGFSIIEARFIESALKMGILPAGISILELGESNVIPEHAAPDLLSLVAPYLPPDRVAEAARRITQSRGSRSQYQKTFGTARALYHAIFDPSSYTAIDLEIGPRRYCFDLNGPVEMRQRFDCVINNGTSEHVFDQANVFRIMHNHTQPGGIIINMTPCLGWIDHGFYSIQPGFFFDLARANGYEIDLIGLTTDRICHQLHSGNEVWDALRSHPELSYSELCTVLRKTADAPFVVPVQGMWMYQSPGLTLATMPRRYAPQMRPNLALNRPALQSSTSVWSWHDDPALDAAGGNDGRITGLYGFCTEFEPAPWWMVDLCALRPLTDIYVYNRLDEDPWACRAAHLTVALSDDAQTWRTVFSRTDDAAFGGADGNPLLVQLGGQIARYVRVSLPGEGFLHLDEIEVY